MCMSGTTSPNIDRAEYEESLKVFWDFSNVLSTAERKVVQKVVQRVVQKASEKPIFAMLKISRRWE